MIHWWLVAGCLLLAALIIVAIDGALAIARKKRSEDIWAAFAVAKEVTERLALRGYVAMGSMCEGGATVTGPGRPRVFISETDAHLDHSGCVQRTFDKFFEAPLQ